MSRGRAREKERKQASDFEEAECCPSAIVWGQHNEKMKGTARGNWNPREDQQSFLPNSNVVGTAPPR